MIGITQDVERRLDDAGRLGYLTLICYIKQIIMDVLIYTYYGSY